ncbi:MAG: hypothetical protein IPK66_08290 [Rhodospirillales bacterium]|nr:hypothetical protein [Rhodospirillales bacterium]
MPSRPNLEQPLSVPYVLRRPLIVLDLLVRNLQQHRSTTAIAIALLPMFVVLLFPAGFAANESQYFMLAYRKLAPNVFSPFSAAFDESYNRIASQVLMGGAVDWFGYVGGQIAMRVVMMLLYAASLAFMLSGIGFSVVESSIALAIYGLVGPDLMGAEWLFTGVEPKTFAYVFVFVAFGCLWRERIWTATAAMVFATWMHFLVGGFWVLAMFVLLVLRSGSWQPLPKLLAVYSAGVLPLLAIIVRDMFFASEAPIPLPYGLTSSYLYSVIRIPHHSEPFASAYILGFWVHGIIATIGLSTAAAVLAVRLSDTPRSAQRALLIWLALLLVYLLVMLGLSAFDTKSGILGEFLPFRPSALILFFCIVAILLLFSSLADGEIPGLRDGLICATFIVVVPLMLWDGAKESIKLLTLGSGYTDLQALIAFIKDNAGEQDIVLTDPQSDMTPLGADLPRLIPRPTLVSFKFVPFNPVDISRWWKLLKFRDAVYSGDCPKATDPPVRFLLYIDRPSHDAPGCGQEVWRSEHFMLAEVPSVAQ